MKQKNYLLMLCLALCWGTLRAQGPTLERKIGQMIMFGMFDTIPDTGSAFYQDVQEGRVGGILLYERNLTPANTAENLRRLISTYQAAAATRLFVSIDHEGGVVNRLKPRYGFPALPSADYLGSLNNPDSTKYYGDNAAYTLSRLGINLNYAPVLDVKYDSNLVLGSRGRTFSADPDIIIKHARQIIDCHRYFGVLTAVKHFPGHGSSTADSHKGMVDVSDTWSRRELLPYRRLIREKRVDMVMTAHIINRQLEKDTIPATLSHEVITRLLRKKLKYKGVVVSDDMQMEAISRYFGVEEAIKMSILAGVDLIMFSNNIPNNTVRSPRDIVAIIRRLVETGQVPEKRIDEAYERIMKLKARMKI